MIRKNGLKKRIAVGLATLGLLTTAGVAVDLHEAEPAQAWTYTDCFYWNKVVPGGSYAYSRMQTCTKNYNGAEEGYPYFYRDYKVTWNVTTGKATTNV